jgi:hypothetical protein
VLLPLAFCNEQALLHGLERDICQKQKNPCDVDDRSASRTHGEQAPKKAAQWNSQAVVQVLWQ